MNNVRWKCHGRSTLLAYTRSRDVRNFLHRSKVKMREWAERKRERERDRQRAWDREKESGYTARWRQTNVTIHDRDDRCSNNFFFPVGGNIVQSDAANRDIVSVERTAKWERPIRVLLLTMMIRRTRYITITGVTFRTLHRIMRQTRRVMHQHQLILLLFSSSIMIFVKCLP